MSTKAPLKTSALAAMLALSLSQMPAAHAGIGDVVKGAFVSTGEALKNTARAGGEVIKGTAKVSGEALSGTAHLGEAAAVATGKAVGTTAGAVAGATGEILTGTGKAVTTTSEATAAATGDLLGIKHKPTAAAATANPANLSTASQAPATQAPATQAAMPAVIAPTSAAIPAVTNGRITPPGQLGKAGVQSATNPVTSATARTTVNTGANVFATTPVVPSGMVTSRTATQPAQAVQPAVSAPVPYQGTTPVQAAKAAPVKAVKQQAVKQMPAQTAARTPASPTSLPGIGNINNLTDPADIEAAKIEAAKIQAANQTSGKADAARGYAATKISKHQRDEIMRGHAADPGARQGEMTAAQELQALAPAQISNDITEGTRIEAPVEDSNVSPSWNTQQPVASSTSFAQQYTLHTTPLKPVAQPAVQNQVAAPQAAAGAPVPLR